MASILIQTAHLVRRCPKQETIANLASDHNHPTLYPPPHLHHALFPQIKGVLNSSQQLAISFERHQAGSSGGNQAGGAGTGQASPSLGFAYRRTPRSNAYIQPRGFGGGGVAGSGKKDGKGNAPMSSSARLLSEGALTPSAKSGILSPDAYLSGGVKRLNIPTDTEERRQRFSATRPLIRGSATAAAAATTPSDARRSQPDVGATSNGGSGGVEEAKGEAASMAAVTGTTSEANGGGASSSNGHHRVEFAVSSPDGSARRNTQGASSPPPSTGGIGTDVRAAATGADESLLDGSPAGGRLFQGDGGAAAASSFAPKLDLEEYDTKPPMSKLAAMGEDALRAVSGFVVSRPGYGSIAWKEPVDLRGVDIGKVVRRVVCFW